jgi:hypothetical protein
MLKFKRKFQYQRVKGDPPSTCKEKQEKVILRTRNDVGWEMGVS